MAVPPLSAPLKSALELGPVALFVFVNYLGGKLFGFDDKTRFMVATLVFMIAIGLSLLIHYLLTKEWPLIPILMAIPVLVFGGLTLYFDDERFLKMKPTIFNSLVGCTLLLSLFLKKNLLRYFFGNAFQLKEEGWCLFTLRYALFSLVLALINELVWRTQSTDFWVGFKFWGFTSLTFIFMILQLPLFKKHHQE